MEKILAPLAADHRGFLLKSLISTQLQELGHDVCDLGPDCTDSCDAGDYALKVVAELKQQPQARGVLICGSGQAMAMTANRFQHIRAALCLNTTMARLAREHNDANILVLGAHIIGQEVALDCVETFFKTPFLGGRFVPRRDKLTQLGGL